MRRNLGLTEPLRAVAVALHATPAQAAIAWVAAQGADVVPLIGARNRSRLGEALGSIDLELTASDISASRRPYRIVRRWATHFQHVSDGQVRMDSAASPILAESFSTHWNHS